MNWDKNNKWNNDNDWVTIVVVVLFALAFALTIIDFVYGPYFLPNLIANLITK